jgi:hypothetical protein
MQLVKNLKLLKYFYRTVLSSTLELKGWTAISKSHCWAFEKCRLSSPSPLPRPTEAEFAFEQFSMENSCAHQREKWSRLGGTCL